MKDFYRNKILEIKKFTYFLIEAKSLLNLHFIADSVFGLSIQYLKITKMSRIFKKLYEPPLSANTIAKCTTANDGTHKNEPVDYYHRISEAKGWFMASLKR